MTRQPAQDRPLAQLSGLGPQTAAWLAEVGVTTEAELRRLGAPAAWRRLKHANPRVTRNALWGLHAALTGQRWTDLDAATKRRLLAAAGEAAD